MKLIRFYGLIVCFIYVKCASNQDKNNVVLKNVNMMKLQSCEKPLLRSSDYNDGKILRYMTQDTSKKERKSVEACQKYRSKLLQNEITNQDQAGVRRVKRAFAGGGEIAASDEFPYMVALGYFSSNGSYKFLCGGSLISTTYVLTAPHCIDMDKKDNVKIVRIGTTLILSDTKDTGYDHKVKKTLPHPEYNKSRKLHDIGLIQLQSSVVFCKSVKPLCLYTENNDPTSMEIAGWGASNFAGESGPNLLKAVLRTVPRQNCSEAYRIRNLDVKIESCHICAGDNRTNICEGDSGGPLLIKGTDMSYQVGVISHGEPCGSKTPGLFARVSSYLNWIEDIVWNGLHY